MKAKRGTHPYGLFPASVYLRRFEMDGRVAVATPSTSPLSARQSIGAPPVWIRSGIYDAHLNHFQYVATDSAACAPPTTQDNQFAILLGHTDPAETTADEGTLDRGQWGLAVVCRLSNQAQPRRFRRFPKKTGWQRDIVSADRL
jgi:hypothetical protein